MNVLSVDGGGIRGVIPAMVLADLEARTGKPTAELFDLIAGTSTGGIIALALTVPGGDGKPRWTANDLVGLYLTAAAPTYFEPEKLTAEGATFALCDGGVFAANPAMCAFAEARRRHPRADIRLVSLGTGQLTKPLHYEQVKGWGLIEWARPLIDVV